MSCNEYVCVHDSAVTNTTPGSKLKVFLRDGIKKTPMGAVNLFGKLLTFGHLNNWSQGWARRLLRTTCGH